MTQVVHRYRNIMKAHNRTLLLLEVISTALFIVLLLPLLNYCLELVLHLWGVSYLTVENIRSFLTFPPTLLLLILFLIILPIFLLFKMTTAIYYCSNANNAKKPTLPHILLIGFIRTLRCIGSSNIALPFYALFLYLFTCLPILIGITIYVHIDPMGGASDGLLIKGFIILGLVFLAFITFPGIFTIHFCSNEHLSFMNGLEQSKMLLKGRLLKTFGKIFLFNLVLTIGFLVFYYIVLFLAALQVYLFTDKSMVINVFLSIYPRINIYTVIFFSMISFITNINMISTLYNSYCEEEFKEIQPQYNHPPKQIKSITKNRRQLLISLLLILVAIGIFNSYLIVRNGSFSLEEALSGIRISSHRGNSYVAPENTLPALDNAIIARSDYAEIDIQQTKDQVIVLLHDKSLWRTAGLNRNIWTLTYKQVKELDAGTWFGKEFIHTGIPTLEEALILCKGKIKLNIEIKANGYNQGVEEQLVALIEKYDFEYQCVVSSWNYASLIRIKQLNSRIKTGYIMSAAYGDFYHKKYVDFFSVRSRYLTKHLVDSAHHAGKEVQAWTVNTINEIERMKSIGVDCIISDNPTLTREIVYRNDTNKTFIELLRRMLYKRSFYSLVFG